VSERTTLETDTGTFVLLVGPTPEVIEAAKRAAYNVPAAEVVICEVKEAATRIAELKPFAIVMSEDVYSFDAAEFDALARDVRGRLLTVSDASTVDRLERRLRPQLLEAYRRRDSMPSP
jgi:hypothetical protein